MLSSIAATFFPENSSIRISQVVYRMGEKFQPRMFFFLCCKRKNLLVKKEQLSSLPCPLTFHCNHIRLVLSFRPWSWQIDICFGTERRKIERERSRESEIARKRKEKQNSKNKERNGKKSYRNLQSKRIRKKEIEKREKNYVITSVLNKKFH